MSAYVRYTPMRRLKERRESQNLTLAALAKKVGCNLQTIYTYEAGRRAPSIKTLRKLAQALKCSTADLLDEDSEETTEKAEA